MTTGERVYKKDKRSKIAFGGSCIENLVELLECVDVTEEFENVDNTLDDDLQESIFIGKGFAPTLITDFTKKDTDKEEAFKPSDVVLSYPRELRLLSYYQRCLVEESKYSSSIF